MCYYLFESVEVDGVRMDIDSVLSELVVYVLFRDFPVAEVVQDIAGVAHLDTPSVLSVVKLERIHQISELELLSQAYHIVRECYFLRIPDTRSLASVTSFHFT